MSVEQRIIVTFLSRKGVKSAEILRRPTAQFAEEILKRIQVYYWHKKFTMTKSQWKMRSMHVNCEQASLRRKFLRSVRWLKKTPALQRGKLLHTPEYHMGVPNQSFQMITEKCRQCGFLTSWRKIRKQTVLLYAKDLARYWTEGDDFWRHIDTCDETWVHHYIPESKETSME